MDDSSFFDDDSPLELAETSSENPPFVTSVTDKGVWAKKPAINRRYPQKCDIPNCSGLESDLCVVGSIELKNGAGKA